MSGFLKFIVHLIVFLSIITILALAVPPFVGISTVVIDDVDMETNLPLGSVTYGKEMPSSSILIGDPIVIQEGNQAYRYRIQEIDLDNSMFTVLDTGNASVGPKALTIRGNVIKVTVTVGYIGYLLMAIQSKEGLAVIGLGIVFLIILFVLAEIWGRDKEEQEAEQDETGNIEGAAAALRPEGQENTPRQLKKEARARQKAEVARLKAESKERRREEKEKLKAARRIARTGGFIEDMEPVETILGLDGDSPADQAADQAHEELKKEIEAATTAVSQEQSAEQEKSPTQEIPAQVSEKTEEKEQQETETEEPKAEEVPAEGGQQNETARPEEKAAKIAIPLYTAEELLERAEAAGDTPKVIQDEETGVVLLDYSSIIGGKSEDSDI